MLSQPRYLPDGRVLFVEGDVLDIGRRLNEGDATRGWEGDPTMRLVRASSTSSGSGETWWWEVWRDSETDGEPYCCLRSKPFAALDARIIDLIVAADSRKRDVVAEVHTHNERILRDRQAAADERMEEANDKLLWGLRKDGVHRIA